MLLAAHYFTNINGMVLFWIAFILTRPLGAVVGNVLSKSAEQGGLEWENGPASAALIGALVVLGGLPNHPGSPPSPAATAAPGGPAHQPTATSQRSEHHRRLTDPAADSAIARRATGVPGGRGV